MRYLPLSGMKATLKTAQKRNFTQDSAIWIQNLQSLLVFTVITNTDTYFTWRNCTNTFVLFKFRIVFNQRIWIYRTTLPCKVPLRDGITFPVVNRTKNDVVCRPATTTRRLFQFRSGRVRRPTRLHKGLYTRYM